MARAGIGRTYTARTVASSDVHAVAVRVRVVIEAEIMTPPATREFWAAAEENGITMDDLQGLCDTATRAYLATGEAHEDVGRSIILELERIHEDGERLLHARAQAAKGGLSAPRSSPDMGALSVSHERQRVQQTVLPNGDVFVQALSIMVAIVVGAVALVAAGFFIAASL